MSAMALDSTAVTGSTWHGGVDVSGFIEEIFCSCLIRVLAQMPFEKYACIARAPNDKHHLVRALFAESSASFYARDR